MRAAAPPPGAASARPAVLWFRKGLRLHDNPALLSCCGAEGRPAVYPVFCLDPHFVSPEKVGAVRMRFLLEALADLHGSLAARGAALIVLRGPAAEVLPKALRAWGAGTLAFESDTEPYARVRDAAVRAAAEELGVKVVTVRNVFFSWGTEQASEGRSLCLSRIQPFNDLPTSPPPPLSTHRCSHMS